MPLVSNYIMQYILQQENIGKEKTYYSIVAVSKKKINNKKMKKRIE